MTEHEIRLNWDRALEKAEQEDFTISDKIGWGFSYQDLMVLGCLHEAGLHRRMIEDLLEDCNFHEECSLLENINYDKYRELVNEEYFG